MLELMHDVETEIVHQISYPGRDDDRLIGGHPAQAAPIEMIEMRVGHENEIDRGEMIDVKAGAFQPFDHAQPHRPIGVDEHIHPRHLNQKGSVPDPGDADFLRPDFGKERVRAHGRSAW